MPAPIGKSTFPEFAEMRSLESSAEAFDAENPLVMQRVFRRKRPKMSEDFVRMLNIEPVGFMGYTGEWGDPPEDAPIQGKPLRIFAQNYALMTRISGNAIEDKRIDEVTQRGKQLGWAARRTLETLSADVFNSGFSLKTTGPRANSNAGEDGIVYFSGSSQTSHSLPMSATYDTRPATDLSLTWQNVLTEIINVQSDHQSARGHELGFMTGEVLLVYGRANAQAAYELFLQGQQPGTANFNRNFIEAVAAKVTPVLWPEISGSAWFLIDKANNPFVFCDKRGPRFKNDRVFTTDGGRNKVSMRVNFGGGATLRGCRGNNP